MFIFGSYASYSAILQSSCAPIHAHLLSPPVNFHIHMPVRAGHTHWFCRHYRWEAQGEFPYHSDSKVHTSGPQELEKDIYRLKCFILSQPLKSMSITGGGWLHFGVDNLSYATLAHALRNTWLLSSEHLQVQIAALKILGHCKYMENKM